MIFGGVLFVIARDTVAVGRGQSCDFDGRGEDPKGGGGVVQQFSR
jgi:hypothetical protein